ncbi:MAG: YncE family protein [Chthoniobacterales bacterium]
MRKVKRIAISLVAICAAVDLLLVLGVVHREWFSSLSTKDYLWAAWDSISLWSGRALTIGSVLVPIVVYVLKKRWPVERTWKDDFASLWEKGSTLCNRSWAILAALGVLVMAAATFTYLLRIEQPYFAAPASPVLITFDGSEVYYITQQSQKHGKILHFDTSTGKDFERPIDVGGRPDRMLEGSHSHCIYVLDTENAKVTVLNPNHSMREIISSRGQIASSIALTPDERKLYISNQQPSPHATITVIDLTKKDRPWHSIGGLNCPMGIGILPDGSKLYVASQCGSGEDPVFVIDAREDKGIRAIKGFATGSELAVAGRSPEIYVSRSDFTSLDENDNPVRESPRISVIDPATDKSINAETIDGGGSALTVSPDGQYFFFSTSKSIKILNTKTRATHRIFLSCAAAGIAVGAPNRKTSSFVLYAWLPDQDRIFFTGLDGLLP